jgi:hypothetical protein
MVERLPKSANVEMVRAAVIGAIQKRTMLSRRRHTKRPSRPHPFLYRLT